MLEKTARSQGERFGRNSINTLPIVGQGRYVLNCILFFRSSQYKGRNIMKLDIVIFFGSNKELVSLSGQPQPNLKGYKSPRAWQQ